MRVATWNVHGCVGTDARTDPARVAAVVRELSAEVVALQEVASGPGAAGAQWSALARGAGLHGIHGPAHLRDAGPFGNALLTSVPVEEAWTLDLSVPGREPRAALVARLTLRGRTWTVVATHLGLLPAERVVQAERLLAVLADDGPLLLLADVNAFIPWSPTLRRLRRRLGRPVAPLSFPSRWPALPLDRIWAGGGARLSRGWAHRSPLSRLASDHLPVCGEVEVA